MDNLLYAALLGIVEGLTEFLPVSSTGHLIIAGNLLGVTGHKAATFEVAIQLGAILAVVWLYRHRFLGLLRSDPGHALSGPRGLWLLLLTTVPGGLAGLALHDSIKALFFPSSVAWALGVGALAILAVERWRPRSRLSGVDAVTPLLALGVGCFQCLALWPGFSRAAATIMGGMLLGLDRKTAAEYSFLAAVPIMVAATGYDVLKSWDLLSAGDLPFFAVGLALAFVSALVAVRWFIGLLGRMTLRPFAWYRLVIAPLVLIFWSE